MIYVHVPFCRSFCTYCDFYSELVCRSVDGSGIVAKSGRQSLPGTWPPAATGSGRGPAETSSCKAGTQETLGGYDWSEAEGVPRQACAASSLERYASELCAEIAARREEIAASTGVRTLYIGGGTPSVLPLECLRKIVEALREADGGGPWTEFTVEVNPEDIVERGPDYVRGLLELGVNRISMGVQSLDEGILRWMNRRHSADGARKAWQILSDATGQGRGWHGFAEGSPAPAAFERSVDLISGVPGMSLPMLERTVDEVLEWRPEHISAYQLSVEEGSALARMIADGRASELPDEECRAQYDLLCRKLADAGYHHYEISNWALPGHEARHNSAYWTRAPYVGLGPGAHSLEYLDASGRPIAGSPCEKGQNRQTPPVEREGGLAKSSENARASEIQAGAGIRQVRKWNSQRVSGWSEEGREELSPEEIREESVMLLARTDRGPIPERDWFIADDLIPDLL